MNAPDAASELLGRLDRLPFGRPQGRLLLMGGLGYTFDGMDAALIAFILAPVARLWSLSDGRTGILGSSLMAGYLVGAFLAGTLGDLVGRRVVMMHALLIYTVATLFAALAPSWGFLYGCRVVAGIGVGAESAIIAPFLSECVQTRYRGRFIGSLAGFFSFGWLLAALLGYFIVPSGPAGWRIAQGITALPILMLLWWRRSLPESPRWLLQQGRTAQAEAVVAAMEAELTAQGKVLPPPWPVPAVPARRGTFTGNLAALWGPGQARTTLMLWLLWLAIAFAYYGFFTWIPTLLVKEGMTLTRSFGYSILIYGAQVPGYYSAAALTERLDRKWTIVGYLVLGGVAAGFLAGARSPASLAASAFLLSFFLNGTFAGIYAYTPELYPTDIRSTGMGVASAFGRIGGLAAPLIIGFSYARIGFLGVFSLTTAVLAAGAMAVAVLGVRTAGRSLEQIGAGPLPAD